MTAAKRQERERALRRRRPDKARLSPTPPVWRAQPWRNAASPTRAGARGPDRAEIFWIVQKTDVGRSRRVERRDIADADVERDAGSWLGTGKRDDLGNRQTARFG